MFGVVLDTNIVVSAHVNPDGWEALVFDLVLSKRVECFITPTILKEYEFVLRRKKFSFDPSLVTRSVSTIKSVAHVVHPTRKISIYPDEEDNRFLECAQAARADFLVTGNTKHFPMQWKKTKIVNARQLIILIIPFTPVVIQHR
ncbi:MAG: putative toxin-antitoxin system toxin component, PIN family [Candidatus Kerfeldbacteria bacterium]|nr:putative toxin-antitoxin system toxin component, PIN family [Candidatus Kerfeldbacteria bacterium]